MPSNTVKTKSGDRGIVGETIAKLKLWQNGYNVYSRFLDVDVIDMVVRCKEDEKVYYKEIQVKWSNLFKKGKNQNNPHYWFAIKKKAFEINPNCYFLLICKNEDDIFIFPARELRSIAEKCSYNTKDEKYDVKIYPRGSSWVIKRLSEYGEIEISKWYNDFEIIKEDET